MKKILLLSIIIYLFQQAFSQPYNIGERTITFVDPSRQTGIFFPSDREIETRIYYPAQASGNNQTAIQGDFPLIVIGHGFGMNSQHYENYWLELVPRGYIVALPRTESAVIPFPSHPDFGLDLAFVENAMFVQNYNSSSPFYQTMRQASAIMGHSMGGGCTFLAAENNPSPRLKTIVGLAAAETNTSAINAAQNVTVDALVFGGSGDGVTPPAENQIPMYNNLASQCKFYVEIIGGGHCNFASSSNTCQLGEVFTGGNQLDRATQHQIIYAFLNPWLDFKLKESCEAWDLFQENLNTSTDITFQESCNYVITPNVEISPNGNIDLCLGETTDLIGNSNANYTYQWFDNNGSINNATTNEFTALETGTYFLEATTLNFGCKDSSSLALVNIASNDTTFVNLNVCFGASITLDNGVIVNSDTIVYETFNSINNCDSVVEFNVSKSSELTHFTNQIYLCEGDSFELPNGDFATEIGLYDGDTLQNIFGCDSVFRSFELKALSIDSVYIDISINSNEISFTLIDAPAYDSILWESDLPVLNNSQNNDTLLIEVPNPVNDSVVVTIFKGACSFSETIFFNRTWNSIANALIDPLTIYPNPTSNILTIELPQNREFEQEIAIFNLLGKVVYKDSISKQNNQIDVSHLASGVYTIISENAHAKFIKNE